MRVRIDAIASYAIGTIAMYWVIERTFAFLGLVTDKEILRWGTP
jgi:ABC-type dipeptide/oligopeptide/nickel transport system permease subunit